MKSSPRPRKDTGTVEFSVLPGPTPVVRRIRGGVFTALLVLTAGLAGTASAEEAQQTPKDFTELSLEDLMAIEPGILRLPWRRV